MIGNGILLAMLSNAPRTHLASLLGTERFSVQPVATSVTVSVKVLVERLPAHAFKLAVAAH